MDSGIPNAPYPSPNMGLVLDAKGDLPPGVGYSGLEIAADQSVNTTKNFTAGTHTEASPLDIASLGPFAFDGGTLYIAEFFCSHCVVGAAVGAQLGFSLWIDGADAGRMAFLQNNVAAALVVPVCAPIRFTPAAGTHSFKVRGWAVTANASINPDAWGTGKEPP